MTDWCARWDTGETPWDRGGPAPPLLELLETSEGKFLRSARVLVPGCGSGHDVRALSDFGAKVMGLDISARGVEVAREQSTAGDECYECGNFFDWTTAVVFDAIWEHTCFCAIDLEQRPLYAAAAARLIRPGGRLVGVFYLHPSYPGADHVPPPHGAEKEEIIEQFSQWFTLVWEKVPDRAYSGREGKEWLAVFERRAG